MVFWQQGWEHMASEGIFIIKDIGTKVLIFKWFSICFFSTRLKSFHLMRGAVPPIEGLIETNNHGQLILCWTILSESSQSISFDDS